VKKIKAYLVGQPDELPKAAEKKESYSSKAEEPATGKDLGEEF